MGSDVLRVGLFDLSFAGKSKNLSLIDLGDQFLALQKGRPGRDDGRHFGILVDDKTPPARDGRSGLSEDACPSSVSRLSTRGATV